MWRMATPAKHAPSRFEADWEGGPRRRFSRSCRGFLDRERRRVCRRSLCFRLTPGTPCLLSFLFVPTGRNEIDCCDGFSQGDIGVTVAHLARRVPHDFLFDTIRHASDQSPRRKGVAEIMLVQILDTSPLTPQGPGASALPAFFAIAVFIGVTAIGQKDRALFCRRRREPGEHLDGSAHRDRCRSWCPATRANAPPNRHPAI